MCYTNNVPVQVEANDKQLIRYFGIEDQIEHHDVLFPFSIDQVAETVELKRVDHLSRYRSDIFL